jgi:hypothetical protein
VIRFLQKTWFFWWLLATLVILRWFQLSSSRADEKDPGEGDSAKEEASAASTQVPAGTTNRQFT